MQRRSCLTRSAQPPAHAALPGATATPAPAPGWAHRMSAGTTRPQRDGTNSGHSWDGVGRGVVRIVAVDAAWQTQYLVAHRGAQHICWANRESGANPELPRSGNWERTMPWH